MNQDHILKIFRDSGAFLEGHFILTSGLHSSHYIQCAKLFEDPNVAASLVNELAAAHRSKGIEWIVGPAMGGILLAYELARALGARNAFTERVDGKMALRRNFVVPPKSRVLVAEDVLTTGGSAVEVANLLQSGGAEVVGIAALVDRGNRELPFPKSSLLSLKLEAVPAESCALCKSGKPITKPGSRPST